MLTELCGKGGCVCRPAREGQLRCPLIVRPTSEDVITGHVFGTLEAINPRWWLPDFLNTALGAERFRRQIFRRLRISLWENRPVYPRELLPWNEGSTQVDAVIRWENPPTTVYVEAKYTAELSSSTAGDDGTSGYPSDQLIRNIRVGLHECRWFKENRLFEEPTRDFIQIVLAPQVGANLVGVYRDEQRLQAAIPFADRLRGLPTSPFLGEIGYRQITQMLKANDRFLSRSERILAERLSHYLEMKSAFSGKRIVATDPPAAHPSVLLTEVPKGDLPHEPDPRRTA